MPPRWIVEPTDVSVERNRHVTLHCQAQGVPIPTVLWKKATGNINRKLSSAPPPPFPQPFCKHEVTNKQKIHHYHLHIINHRKYEKSAQKNYINLAQNHRKLAKNR